MSTPYSPPPRRRLTRAEVRRRRRQRAIRRIAVLTAGLCLAVGGVFLLVRGLTDGPKAGAASSQAESLPAAASSTVSSSSAAPESAAPSASEDTSQNISGLTASQAQAMLDDPLMVLVNHDHQMPADYTFDTKECGSATSINKTLQIPACDAFLQMQAAAAADGVTIWMQSGYRSVEYQTKLYTNKTNYYLNQGFDEATAKEKAAGIVNPPGYSEHNCGLAADLNSPEHTELTEGFEDTAAFRWLQQHAGEYGFILRYPKGMEAFTEITYEPWHWRYVGVENAARINASGLCFEQYWDALQKAAQSETAHR